MKNLGRLLRENTLLLLLVTLSIIPLFDLLHPGLPITHDGQDHVARIANFYQNLTEGNFIPRWAGNLNWGFGHPTLMFLYPLSSYFASLFHAAGFSFVDSVKIVFALAFILSGASMYLWIKNVFGEKAGFIAGVLYIFAPYRFVDLYVRGAIGEHVAFIFPPLICYFLLKLSQKYSYWYILGGAFSLAGLILSHNAITLMFLPFIIMYTLFLMWINRKNKKLMYLYSSILVFGIGVSSFFLLPAYFEGKYTLRDIVTAKEYASRFVDLPKFFYSPWSYGGTGQLSVQIGFSQIIGVLLSLFWFVSSSQKEKKIRSFFLLLISCFIFGLFIMTAQSKFLWDNFTILQKFQFPWRFLTIIIFVTAVLSAYAFKVFPESIRKYTLVGLVILALVFNQGLWHANGYLEKDESFFSSVYPGTTDTGESSPIWSVRFMEQAADKPIEALSGNAQILIIKRSQTDHEYEITARKRSQILENTLYFPGWDVLIDGKKLQTSEIEYQDQKHRGLITFYVPKGEHRVSLKFQETKLRSVANIISVMSLVSLLLIGFFSFLKFKFKLLFFNFK